jgi:methionyl-tRNA synthetase
MATDFYITTAIDYVNGRPHLGHAYEKVLTDTLARWARRQGQSVFFLTGVDEHGMKVQQSAAKAGQDPQTFCDRMSGHFRDLYDRLDISYDDFIRTTEDRHKEVVQAILSKIHDDGDIYPGTYEGYYSPRQEQFLTEDDQVDGQWPEQFGEVVHLSETVYYFRLSKYQDWLASYLKENPDWIFPAFRTKEVLGALEKPIPDLCISRPTSRLNWGIPLPFDSDQVTYVWFDALINYVSGSGFKNGQAGEAWPAVHVIGKDIMVPAHAIYWPIMLKAAGIPMPKRLLVHGFWTSNSEKMSKTTGNVVDPLELIDVYGRDAFRYYVLREMALGQDADFSVDSFHTRYQSELGNNLGNLVQRTISMLHRYRGGIIPEAGDVAPQEESLSNAVLESIRDYRSLMEEWQPHRALTELFRGITRANQYIEECAPWKLAKEESEKNRLDTVLHSMIEAIYLLISELEPILPDTVEQTLSQLGGWEVHPASDELIWTYAHGGKKVAEAKPLFPRIEIEAKNG